MFKTEQKCHDTYVAWNVHLSS